MPARWPVAAREYAGQREYAGLGPVSWSDGRGMVSLPPVAGASHGGNGRLDGGVDPGHQGQGRARRGGSGGATRARNRSDAAHVSRTMTSDEQQVDAPLAGLASPSAVSADPPGVNDYDSFAEAYSAENEASLINAYYERPAMLALAGDVAGRGSSTPAAAPALCSRRCATGAPS